MRLLVIDPASLTRECLTSALGDLAMGMEVIGACAVDACDASDVEPDAVLLNLARASMGGAEAEATVQQVRAALPGAPVIVLADDVALDAANAAFRLGARGYLSFFHGIADILDAVRTVRSGGFYLPVQVSAELRRDGVEPPVRRQTASAFPETLTQRQREVLDALLIGKSNKVIAFQLGMQESTVKVHVRSILRALGATNRTEAAYLARTMSPGRSGRASAYV